MHQKQNSSTKLDATKYIVLESNESVQGLNNDKQQITGGTPRRGRYRFNTSRNTNPEDLQRINTAISVAREYLKKAKDSNEELKKIFDEYETHFE